ncbi:MAG TPA: 2-dehydropantoate 2-reductase [Casimicrobiaceae bacterium]|nr:2-dehydropantoate 2-reductase [Casimicrobiaceae bacterium]
MNTKIAIVGAGAIGCFVGARLSLAGNVVTLIARGANRAAIERNGVHLIEAGGERRAREIVATDDYHRTGPQDVVLLTVKANQLESVAPKLAPLLTPNTPIVTMQNGIPWWYFSGHGGELDGRSIASVDPAGAIAESLPAHRIIGCVVYAACTLVTPGVVRHSDGDRFLLGELDGTISERVTRVSECFAQAGLKAPIMTNIRAEIWMKLWGNCTLNPISAVTRSNVVDICADPHSRALVAAMMAEVQCVAGKLGIAFPVSIDQRITAAERLGAFKTSMLQDVEARRPLEIDALLGSVIELARVTRTPTPHLEAVFALCKRLSADLANSS